MVRVSRVSAERDRPSEATSSEEVKAAFVPLQSAACLVIIPLPPPPPPAPQPALTVSTDRAFQERPRIGRPTGECTTHRQQRLTPCGDAERPDWRRHC